MVFHTVYEFIVEMSSFPFHKPILTQQIDNDYGAMHYMLGLG